MKISTWPNTSITTKDIEYKGSQTNFLLDIKFQSESKTYHIAEQFIEPCDWDEDSDNDDNCPVFYSRITFSVDAVDLSPKEITDILVNYLAHYKLYLHHFSITEQETYISYASIKDGSSKTFDLMYSPAYRNDSIYIDAVVQLEDDVDYYRLLDIRTKEIIKSISDKKLKELGYEINEYGIRNFAILDEKSAKEYLNL